MRDTDATSALPTFEGPRCRVHADGNAETHALAAALIGWLDKEDAGANAHAIVVAHAADPASATVADALASTLTGHGGSCDLLETSLPSVVSHAIIAGAYEAGILVEGASEHDTQCTLALFGADGLPLDATSARRLRTCVEAPEDHGAATPGHLGQASHGSDSYLDSLTDAFGALGHVSPPSPVHIACVAPGPACGQVEAALSRMASAVEVVAADEGADLGASLERATELAVGRGFDAALAFDGALARVACAAIGKGGATRLGDDEATELALAWLLAAPVAPPSTVTLVSDIGSTRAIDALAERFDATLVRTLPGADAVSREVAHQRAASAQDAIVLGITADAALLVSGATGVPCPLALAMALTGAAAAESARGTTLEDALRAIDDEIGCHRATSTAVAFETYDHAPLLMMRLRKDERDLICHMVVTDTCDYLTGQPMPGDPTRTLPFFDAIGWTLSDGSKLVLYADEAASCAHALILVRADTRSEAQAVSFFLAQEAHAILTS